MINIILIIISIELFIIIFMFIYALFIKVDLIKYNPPISINKKTINGLDDTINEVIIMDSSHDNEIENKKKEDSKKFP